MLTSRAILFMDIDGVLNSEAFLKRVDAKHLAHRTNDREDDEERAACTCYAIHNLIDPDAVQRLNRIVAAVPGLAIVLSSSWRRLIGADQVNRILYTHGFAYALGAERVMKEETPDLANDADYVQLRADGLIDRIARGHEIAYWLEAKLGVDPRFSASVAADALLERLAVDGAPKIAILDDGNDMVHLTPWLVLTDPDVGLTDADADRAIQLLLQS